MLLVLCLVIASVSPSSGLLSQTSLTDNPARPCKTASGETPGTRTAPGGKKKHGNQETAPPKANCIEVRLTALDVQEYFQKFIREQQWSTRDEQASEEMWTFTISLEKESLGKYTKPFADPRIRWRGGKGLVRVRTSEKNEGYTEVLVSATFDGFGESEDTLAPRRDTWRLESNGTLETEMIHALELHVQPSP